MSKFFGRLLIHSKPTLMAYQGLLMADKGRSETDEEERAGWVLHLTSTLTLQQVPWYLELSKPISTNG